MKRATRDRLAQLDATYLDPDGLARDVLDSDARLRAEVRRLRADKARIVLERNALQDFVRGMADGYAKHGEARLERTMRSVLREAAALAPRRKGAK